jgi:peptide subunit release factor RF-3
MGIEREREISVVTSVMTFEQRGALRLDTLGYLDFP